VAGWWQGGFSLKPAERAVRSLRSLERLRAGQVPIVFNLNLLVAAVSAGSLVAVFRRQPLAWGLFALLIVCSGILPPVGWDATCCPPFRSSSPGRSGSRAGRRSPASWRCRRYSSRS
jgi:hypothetical protein